MWTFDHVGPAYLLDALRHLGGDKVDKQQNFQKFGWWDWYKP